MLVKFDCSYFTGTLHADSYVNGYSDTSVTLHRYDCYLTRVCSSDTAAILDAGILIRYGCSILCSFLLGMLTRIVCSFLAGMLSDIGYSEISVTLISHVCSLVLGTLIELGYL